MDSKQQKDIVKTICRCLKKDLLNKSAKWPENWDGFELRQLVEDQVKETVNYVKMDRKRMKDYTNAGITKGI